MAKKAPKKPCKKHDWKRWRAPYEDRTFGLQIRLRQCKRCLRWQVQERRPEGWT